MAGTRRGQSLSQSPDRQGPRAAAPPPPLGLCLGLSTCLGKGPQAQGQRHSRGSAGPRPLPAAGRGRPARGCGRRGHPVLPGGAGHLQHSSPTCGPHDEPDRPLPGLPMRLRPRPLRRALLQVTQGWDQEFQVPRQPELTSAPCPPCSAARINAGSDIQGLATSARPEGHGPRSSTLRSGRSNWTARARGLPRCHSKSGAETVTCSAARTESPMAPQSTPPPAQASPPASAPGGPAGLPTWGSGGRQMLQPTAGSREGGGRWTSPRPPEPPLGGQAPSPPETPQVDQPRLLEPPRGGRAPEPPWGG